ncbi:3-oxoacyl-ACP synthase [Xanthomarina sp. F2636L]|uniref:3-oxoacyl-ACP synthase n=1 Tax=Xanthomarina sp. F2636L TaxID=2996018 RepID=UPI00225DF48E|nr:3-oxoacyl-ACP synthase [Xanthomarina sp. F2636L]MCX7551460.1 3-oxoacyl-ACP synthase [Xanthomarina sp. F2636L]
MNTNYNISSYCHIKNQQVSLNGSVIFSEESLEFSEFIKAAYKALNTKYPKFFKMDNLSKLAFLAADILLKNEQIDSEKENDIALVFSNSASSLDTDLTHQKAIQDKDNYFPSPAVFVYTLPNICLGEISIKYKLYTENSFFIFERFNAENLMTYSNSLLETNKAKSVLCGWVELEGENYEAFLYLVSNEGTIKHNKQNIITLYNT